jgi:oligopeptide/dipeptide ABC transporter ATP-binding protein
MTSLNPFLRVGRQLTEVLELHEGLRRGPARQRSIEMLELVGIPDPERRFDAWPHEMSGGMRQRVMIAMALLCQPELLIADEPTTALDVTIQAQILDILRDLQRRLGVATIFITHDLGVVAGIADRVLVMYAGKVMETAPVDELFENPRHPYTEALLRTMPRLDEPARETLYTIEGQPPDPAHKPPGCPFHPRCRYARDVCRAEFPPAVVVREGHTSFCWASEEVGAVAPTGSSR